MSLLRRKFLHFLAGAAAAPAIPHLAWAEVPTTASQNVRVATGLLAMWITRRPARLAWWTAPVSHQKRPLRNATNAINLQRKYNKINEACRYPPAHNGLVAGLRPALPPVKSAGC
jgi:hypothetical protein